MSMQLSGRRVFLANGNGKYLDQVAGSWQGQETARRLIALEQGGRGTVVEVGSENQPDAESGRASGHDQKFGLFPA